MKKISKPLSATEILDRISKQWATKKDVMDIGYIGDTTAGKVMKEITNNVFKEKNKKLPKGLIPMELLIDYFGININYLKKVAKEQIK